MMKTFLIYLTLLFSFGVFTVYCNKEKKNDSTSTNALYLLLNSSNTSSSTGFFITIPNGVAK